MAKTSEALVTPELDLNTATAEELAAAFPELGMRLAFWLIRHRTRSGPFTDAASVAAVKGIDPPTALLLATYIRPAAAGDDAEEGSGLHAVARADDAGETATSVEPEPASTDWSESAELIEEGEDASGDASASAEPPPEPPPEPMVFATPEPSLPPPLAVTTTPPEAKAPIVSSPPAPSVAPGVPAKRRPAGMLKQVVLSLLVSLVAAGAAAGVAVRRETNRALVPVAQVASAITHVEAEQTRARKTAAATRAELDEHGEKIALIEQRVEEHARRQDQLEASQRAAETRQREVEARQARVNAVLTGRIEGVETRLDDRVMTLSQALDAIDHLPRADAKTKAKAAKPRR